MPFDSNSIQKKNGSISPAGVDNSIDSINGVGTMSTDKKDKYIAYGTLTVGLIASAIIGTLFYKAIKTGG